jgi:hypothetical protein
MGINDGTNADAVANAAIAIAARILFRFVVAWPP